MGRTSCLLKTDSLLSKMQAEQGNVLRYPVKYNTLGEL